MNTQEQTDRDDPRFWKLGIFYYNPADKRLFPPKRKPWMGWTVNFASWYSILAMLGLIAMCIGITEYLSS